MRKFIIYCRISGERDTREASVETQESEGRKHLASLGHEVATVFVERHSGADLHEREDLSKAREMIRNNEADGIWVYDTDRLSRNQAHTWVLIDELQRHDAEFICKMEPFEDSPMGKLMLSIRSFRAEEERFKIKDRTMRGRKHKAAKGLVPGQGGAPYGYRVNKTYWTYEVYEPEAQVVRLMYELAAQGLGSRRIANIIREKGYPTPSQSMGRANATSYWHASNIPRVIRHEVYKGTLKTSAYKKVGKRNIKQAEGVVAFQHKVPALVSEELWDHANAVVTYNRGAETRNAIRPHLLRGLVYCLRCGRYCAITSNGRNEYYYRCVARKEKLSDCPAKLMNADRLSEAVWSELRRRLFDPATFAEELAKRQTADNRAKDIQRDLDALKGQAAKINKQRLRTVERLTSADPSDAELYETHLASLRKQAEDLRAEIERTEQLLATVHERQQPGVSLEMLTALHLENLDDATFDRKRAILTSLGLRVYFDGSEVVVRRADEPVGVVAQSAFKLTLQR